MRPRPERPGAARASSGSRRTLALTARHLFERARSACGPPGLFTEEFDVTERQLRGNMPQAFVHAVRECAAVLDPLEVDR